MPAPRGKRQSRAERLAETIYTTHRRRLFTIAKHNCTNAEDAEEALQDAFIAFIRHFDPDGEAPPLAWLTLTLKRECWAHYRREQLGRRLGQEPSRQDLKGAHPEAIPDLRRLPEELTELHEGVAKVRVQLAELKPHERRAIGLLALGYSYREICEITGWTYTKVNRCISEGRARLRELDCQGNDANRR